MNVTTEPIINIVGEKIALGPWTRELVPLLYRWQNDFDVTRTRGSQFRNRTLAAVESGYERDSQGGPDYVDFALYERPTLQPIGWASLERISYFDRTAMYAVTIGEKECWGRGYGTETSRLLLNYGFTCLGLHNIWLTVFSFNERGYRAYQRAGFKEFGRWRQAHRAGGKAYDVIYMDCLATEFQGTTLAHLVPEGDQI